MPKVVRLGDLSLGHTCWPPRPNIQASPNVFANNIKVHRQSDGWAVHCCGPSCHDGNLVSGSRNVFVNSKQIARRGDPVSCGDFANVSSPNVFANGQ